MRKIKPLVSVSGLLQQLPELCRWEVESAAHHSGTASVHPTFGESACGSRCHVAPLLWLGVHLPGPLLLPRRLVMQKFSTPPPPCAGPRGTGRKRVTWIIMANWCPSKWVTPRQDSEGSASALLPTETPAQGKLCCYVQSLGHVPFFATPGTVSRQSPLSVGFSKQEHWSGLPFPSPRHLPNPGIKPGSPTPPALAGRVLALRHLERHVREALLWPGTSQARKSPQIWEGEENMIWGPESTSFPCFLSTLVIELWPEGHIHTLAFPTSRSSQLMAEGSWGWVQRKTQNLLRTFHQRNAGATHAPPGPHSPTPTSYVSRSPLLTCSSTTSVLTSFWELSEITM